MNINYNYSMEIIKLPQFDENGQTGYINLNIKYIKYWSVIKNKDSLNIKIVLTDNMSFNMFYDYCDNSDANLSKERYFNDLVYSLDKLEKLAKTY